MRSYLAVDAGLCVNWAIDYLCVHIAEYLKVPQVPSTSTNTGKDDFQRTMNKPNVT